MNAQWGATENQHVCECCGVGPVQLEKVSVPFLYGDGADAVTLTAEMPVWSCDACGERYTAEGAEEAEHDAICDHMGRLRPSQILSARRQRAMTQEEFSRSLGVSRVSLARWESGAQMQSHVYDRLIRQQIAGGGAVAEKFNHPKFRTNVSHRQLAAQCFELRMAA